MHNTYIYIIEIISSVWGLLRLAPVKAR